jgi:2-polyprenyl-3-methyl-5-hydroxy-6-metoxy-1,4-benzoquinol methylase
MFPKNIIFLELEGTIVMNYKTEKHPKYGYYEIKPTPSPEEIAKFYADEFYSSDYPRVNDSSLESRVKDKDYFDTILEDHCQWLTEITEKPVKGMSILDIGCGWGQSLLYFREKGMECYGFDPAKDAVEYACYNKLNVVQAGIDKMNVFERQFDVITMYNVLEHLANPERLIEEIQKEVLNLGGVLIVDVPNEFNPFQLAAQKTFNLEEWWVAPPAHLNYFSTDTLQALLEDKGFKVKYASASFPMEMFLLFGRNYIGNPTLGRTCHEERMSFESNLRKTGNIKILHRFNEILAKENLGRQVTLFAERIK